jgi:hypothetical protein
MAARIDVIIHKQVNHQLENGKSKDQKFSSKQAKTSVKFVS